MSESDSTNDRTRDGQN
ncbi:unnamed protein product, partial [Rotaria sp. Silwood1]